MQPPPPDALRDEPAVLLLLDGLVRRNGPRPGLDGEVCIGVLRDSGYRWWAARFGPRPECGFLDALSATADACLCLAEEDAEFLLRTGQFPEEPGPLFFSGDRGLFAAFIEAYTVRSRLVDVRAGTS